MTLRHPILLKITPLLDLLLIVMFAQFMDVQSSAQQQVEAEQKRRSEALSAREQFAAANQSLRERVDALLGEVRRLEAQVASGAQQREELEKTVEALAAMAHEQLKIPEEAVREVMANATPGQARRLLEELSRAGRQSVAEIIRYLRTNVEFRNHWDVWEVYVGADDSVRLTANDNMVAEKLFVTNRDNFLQTVRPYFDREEPKSTVLILVSWGDAKYRMRNEVQEGVEALAGVLQGKWARPKKFYISVLGYTPQVP